MIQKSMVRCIVGLCCLAGFVGLGQLASAQEFSADVVNARGNGQVKKVYAGKDKVRFEGNNDATMGTTALIYDMEQNKYVVLMPERRMYMDAPQGLSKQAITHFWRVQDVDDACPQWKKSADEIGTSQNWGSCTKVGNDTVNGRSTVKYEGISKKGEKSHFWVDTKLHCVVKTDQGTGGGMELRNIQEGSQPASLFEVPAGYTKFDMGAMMKQRQQ